MECSSPSDFSILLENWRAHLHQLRQDLDRMSAKLIDLCGKPHWRPIQQVKQFYRERLIAAHELFLQLGCTRPDLVQRHSALYCVRRRPDTLLGIDCGNYCVSPCTLPMAQYWYRELADCPAWQRAIHLIPRLQIPEDVWDSDTHLILILEEAPDLPRVIIRLDKVK